MLPGTAQGRSHEGFLDMKESPPPSHPQPSSSSSGTAFGRAFLEAVTDDARNSSPQGKDRNVTYCSVWLQFKTEPSSVKERWLFQTVSTRTHDVRLLPPTLLLYYDPLDKGNARSTERLYRETYPQRDATGHLIFSNLYHNLEELGLLRGNRHSVVNEIKEFVVQLEWCSTTKDRNKTVTLKTGLKRDAFSSQSSNACTTWSPDLKGSSSNHTMLPTIPRLPGVIRHAIKTVKAKDSLIYIVRLIKMDLYGWIH
ncbi:hypothetical protein TNCV_3693431 [Trichonephila clavipes]|nr:hypothetical protein TNCV_3693431 [Trichonephila clavipes]